MNHKKTHGDKGTSPTLDPNPNPNEKAWDKKPLKVVVVAPEKIEFWPDEISQMIYLYGPESENKDPNPNPNPNPNWRSRIRE